MGGIRTGLDALEFVLAGANAVSVGTAVFGDPSAPIRVLDELARALVERGFTRFEDAIGAAHRPPDPIVPEGPDPVGDELVERRGRGDALMVRARAPIAVALDAPDVETAARWAMAVTPHVSVVKVGLELFCRDRPVGRRDGPRRQRCRPVPRPQAARHPQHGRRRGEGGRPA